MAAIKINRDDLSMAVGREYTLECYSPPIKARYIGMKDINEKLVHAFLIPQVIHDERSIDAIYIKPNHLEIKGNFVKNTGLGKNIVIQSVFENQSPIEFNQFKEYLKGVIAGLN